MDNNYILIGLIILTLACIYLFYLYYSKYNDYDNLHNELIKLKVLNKELQLQVSNNHPNNKTEVVTEETQQKSNQEDTILIEELENINNIDELDKIEELDDLGELGDLDVNLDNVNVSEPVVDVAELVSDVAEPVSDVAEPVVDVAEPVVDVAEPVVDVAEPVVDVKEQSNVDETILEKLDTMNFKEIKLVAKNLNIKIKGNKDDIVEKIKQKFK